MRFELVVEADKGQFEEAVNTKLNEGFVFAGNIVHTGNEWSMPMIKFDEEKDPMETRLARQLWGMFIARLF